jgi:hypothetical protein
MPNKSKIIAATVKVAATAKTGKMIADIDSPIAIAPIPICKALIHLGDFSPNVCSDLIDVIFILHNSIS